MRPSLGTQKHGARLAAVALGVAWQGDWSGGRDDFVGRSWGSRTGPTPMSRPVLPRLSPETGAKPIAILHYSTAAVPPDERHDHWATQGFPSVAAMFGSVPVEPFGTAADQVQLDELTVQFAEGTAREFDRSVVRLRSDGITMLGINVVIDGVMRGEARGQSFVVEPGGVLLLDMMQSSRVSVPNGRSIQIGVPRGLADDQLGPVRRLHGSVIPSDRSVMLIGHLLRLREALPTLSDSQKPRLARTIMDMLAIALERIDARVAVVQPEGRAPTASVVRREIEAQLGLPTLNVASLCQRLGLSRSALYRLFEGDGGVEAYIRRRRLEQVRGALIDPANVDRVGDLAFRWGFSDASHLTRLFREAYGVTPSAMRRVGGPG